MPDFSKLMKTFQDPKKLFGLLRSPTMLVGLLGLGFALSVLRWGRTLFRRGGWRLWAALALLLIAILIFFLVRRAEKKKKAKQIEDSLLLEADSLVMSSSGAQRAANERAREELAQAIENLKKSKVAGGRSGSTALSVLPWFLVLGKAGTGRSKMIRNSGLTFPGSGPQDPRAGKGVGPGQSVAWWFTNEAVVLEANGRFAAREDDAGARHDWQGILEVIAGARGEVPIQGIVVNVSAEDLIRHDVARLEDQARVLRQRLDATIVALKAFTPVHLVITKVDLIHGFQEFFSELAGNARDQVLGATLDPEQVAEDPVRAFSREYDTLYRALCDRRIPRLAQEDRLEKRARIYLFPLEFVALRKKLRGFAKILFEPNPYGERPLFRGFYFASGSLEGEPVEMVLNEVSRVIGLPPDLDSAADVTRVIDMLPERDSPSRTPSSSAVRKPEADPRFVRELFTRVLPTSAALAHPTEAATRQRRLQRFGLLGFGVSLSVALAVFMIVSFVRNGTMIRHTVSLAHDAMLVPAGANLAGDVETRLRQLEPLRDQLDKLDRWDRSTPFTLGFGLYQGGDINKRARAVYAKKLTDVFLGPSRRAVENWLFSSYPASTSEYNAYFDNYRAYLNLMEPQSADSTRLIKQLVSIWSGPSAGGGITESLRESIRKHLSYAWRHPEDIAYQSQQLPPRNGALIDRANALVRQYWRPEYFYESMIEEVNAKVLPFSIATIPGGSILASDPQVVATKPEASSVPGAFSLKGWREEVGGRIQASEAQLRNDIVLKDAFQGQAIDMREWLLQTYKKDYIAHWAQFLSAVDVAPVTGLVPASTRVRDLAQPGSPLVRLLETAASNLRFRGESNGDTAATAAMTGIEDSFAALHSLFAMTGEGKDAHRPLDLYLQSLPPLVDVLRQRSESTDPGLDAVNYAKQMLAQPPPPTDPPIAAAIHVVDRHVASAVTGDEQAAAAVRAILRRPAETAWGAIIHEAQLHIDADWGTSVADPFKTMTGKYPMFASGPDCAFEEFKGFFAPGGGVFWKFYDAELAPFLDQDGHPRIIWGHGLDLGPDADRAVRKAILFRDTFFRETPGAMSFSFRVKPVQTVKVSGTPPFVRTTSLTVGDSHIIYDMGLSTEKKVTWPGDNQTGGARIGVTADGPEPDAISFDGPWALFRLLDRAAVDAKSESEFRVKWTLERKGAYTIAVPYDVRASAASNPFQTGFFQFDCPRQISAVPGSAPATPAPAAKP